MELPPGVEYTRRLRLAQAAHARLDNRGALAANVRGLLFVAAAALILLPVFGKLPREAWWGAALAALLYVVVAAIHARILEQEMRARLRASLAERSLGRLDGRWREHPRRGEAYLQEDDLTSTDLDLFGSASLFQLLSEAVTRPGEARLASLLREGCVPPLLWARQEAVRDLTPRLDFRESFSVEALGGGGQGSDARGLLRWAEGASPLVGVQWARLAPYVLPPITLTLFVLGRLEVLPRWSYLPTILLQLGLVAVTYRAFAEIYALLSPGERGFARLASAFAEIEHQAFTSEHLAKVTAGLRPPTGEPVSTRLHWLARLFSAVEVRQSGLVHGLLNLLTLWDILFFFRLERWRLQHGSLVAGWIEALAELEALSSLAAYAHAHPHFPYPIVRETGPKYVARKLAHPLLDQPVANDVALSAAGAALIVTGSNMSGKSTLLRAMGVNAVLARAGAPVRADQLELTPLRVVTSMRVHDSLERGVSYFYAEVRRLKAVLDAAQTSDGQVLFLLDEILLGTNTRERQIASQEVLKQLLRTGAVGAVTTHDLALTALAEDPGLSVRNVHFEDSLEGGRLKFDYELRDGIVQTTNALHVLAEAGIRIE